MVSYRRHTSIRTHQPYLLSKPFGTEWFPLRDSILMNTQSPKRTKLPPTRWIEAFCFALALLWCHCFLLAQLCPSFVCQTCNNAPQSRTTDVIIQLTCCCRVNCRCQHDGWTKAQQTVPQASTCHHHRMVSILVHTSASFWNSNEYQTPYGYCLLPWSSSP